MLALASSERPKRLEIKIADILKQKQNKYQLNIIIVYIKKKSTSILKSMMRVVLLKIQHSFHMSTFVLKA
jgi:phosphotransferase system HPr-like phosphotransfer protein